MKKKLKIGRAKRDRLFYGASEASPKVRWASVASRRAPQPLGWHHNRKAKHKFRAWNLKNPITKKETKEIQNEPYAPTCPPLQGYEGARTGFVRLDASRARAKETKERKAFPRTPEPLPLPPSPPTSHDKETNKEAGEGAYFSFFFMGGYNKLFEFASLRANSNNLLISYTNLALLIN